MTTWQLDIQKGWRIGLAIVAGLVLIAAAMIVVAVLNPISILTFLLGLIAVAFLAGAGLVSYQLWGLVNAVYTMDRNAVIIHWGNYEYQIPLADIQEVLRGSEAEGLRLRSLFHWPGYFVGRGSAPELGEIFFYATQPAEGQLVLHTQGDTFVISPVDRDGFITALRERLEMGATQDVEAVSQHPAFLDWPIWRDSVALGMLGSSLLMLTLLIASLCGIYPALPAEIPLQITNTGETVRTTTTIRIFYLALMGTLFTLVNGGAGAYLYPRKRMGAYFVWGGLLFLQGSLWVAAATILLNL